jgi:hypothetical protein
MRLSPVQPIERRLDVDERVGLAARARFALVREKLGAHRHGAASEQHAEPGVVVGRRLLAVDGAQQLVAVDPAEPVEHEVCEEQLSLGPSERVFDPPPIQPHDEPAAELDSRLARSRHR